LITALGWAEHIDLALSPSDCGRGRPEPDMIFGAMDRLGVADAAAVAVVGDTTSDLEAGTKAGAGAVIGVLSGAHDAKTLATAPHTDLIADITELIGVLDRT
jgi:phosphoglycolate phosphatase-like HAD superfamily hydrolase